IHGQQQEKTYAANPLNRHHFYRLLLERSIGKRAESDVGFETVTARVRPPAKVHTAPDRGSLELPPDIGIRVTRAAKDDIIRNRETRTTASRKNKRGGLPSKARRPIRFYIYEITPSIVIRSVRAKCDITRARPSGWVRRIVVGQT